MLTNQFLKLLHFNRIFQQASSSIFFFLPEMKGKSSQLRLCKSIVILIHSKKNYVKNSFTVKSPVNNGSQKPRDKHHYFLKLHYCNKTSHSQRVCSDRNYSSRIHDNTPSQQTFEQ